MSGPGAADTVLVGRINGIWGTQGWVKVFSYTQPPSAIFDYQPWLLGQDLTETVVEQWRQQGPRLVARIQNVSDPDQAGGLIGRDLFIPRSALPKPDPGQFYWSDLIGLAVVNLEGHHYGRVRGMIETGANDVLEVVPDSGPSVLIPYVHERYVKQVDLDAGLITVDWPLDWLDTGPGDAEAD
jgi:16S rRNA processing protein RimM